MHADRPKLRCDKLTVRVPRRVLIEDLDLVVEAGSFLAILGPNGVGKSLAMHTMAGLRPADSGDVFLDDTSIGVLTRQRVASKLALLPQYTEDIFPATVFDTVMIGRHPHIGRLRWETADDRNIALDALSRVDLEGFADRDVLTLSGGERRRLAVAQVLTQQPAIYLLDEPTNHLDPQHQLDVLGLFRDKARAGDTIVASLHDVNLAARFADRCLLLFGDGRWIAGVSDEVLTEDGLSELYSTNIVTLPWEGTRVFVAAGR
jgi:iron complex transport system ATP-binding protein